LAGAGDEAPAGAFAAKAIPPVATKKALASAAEAKRFMKTSFNGDAERAKPRAQKRS